MMLLTPEAPVGGTMNWYGILKQQATVRHLWRAFSISMST
jgi:hypothetical protein